MSHFNSPFPETTFFYSVACRARYVSPFDAAEVGNGGRPQRKAFAQNRRPEYYPQGGDFFGETCLALTSRTYYLSSPAEKASYTVPGIQKEQKGVSEKKRRALQVVHLPLCPALESRRMGVQFRQRLQKHRLPLRGREKIRTVRQSLPTFLREKSVRYSPTEFSTCGGCQAGVPRGFFAPAHLARAFFSAIGREKIPSVRLWLCNALIIGKETLSRWRNGSGKPLRSPSRAAGALRLQDAAQFGNVTNSLTNSTLRGSESHHSFALPINAQESPTILTDGRAMLTMISCKLTHELKKVATGTPPRSRLPCPATSSPPRGGGRGTSGRR